MKPVLLATLAALLGSLLLSVSVLGQSAPEFKLGFKDLSTMIPDVVGSPLENERHNPLNGDGLQTTTNGLMVWRKADNWTAFTDGARTWIKGPYGVRDRANDDKFDWEVPPPAPTPAAANPKPAPTPTPAPKARYSPEVQFGDGAAVTSERWTVDFVRKIEADFDSMFGWKPSMPTTIYIYSDPVAAAAKCTALSPAFSSSPSTAGCANLLLGGVNIVVNNSRLYSLKEGQNQIRVYLVDLYFETMMFDLSNGRDWPGNLPSWFRQGFKQVIKDAEIPGWASLWEDGFSKIKAARDAGALPTLRYVNDNESAMLFAPDRAGLFWDIAYFSTGFLKDRVGHQTVLEVLRRTRSLSDFEGVLKDVTGYTLEQLDSEYRVKIP